jgi:hypothetical protein
MESLIRKISLAVVALLASAALAACGGGDDNAGASGSDQTVTTSSHSKAEFVKLANRICDRDRTQLATKLGVYLQQHENEGKSERELAGDAMAAVLLPVLAVQVEEIRALGAPSGDEKTVEELLAALQAAVDKGNALDPEDLRPSAKLARAYGVSSCAYIN